MTISNPTYELVIADYASRLREATALIETMREALREFVKANDLREPDEHAPEWNRTMKLARAALAQAEGRK